ncbi:MAG: SpoIIE family protein phosphatase, partial [Chlorobi bacterium]|nr:SpoIIE family protein phosphatase [Chlorobiota bacterium]
DGITESRNKKGEFYGEQRIKNVILEMQEKTAEEISKGIIEDVNKFTGKEDRSDDKTVVIVKREYSE